MRKAQEGTSAALLQAWTKSDWWAGAQRCLLVLHKFENKFGRTYEGPLWSFGCEAGSKPISKKALNQMYLLWIKDAEWHFHTALFASRGLFSGDVFIVDSKQLRRAEHVIDVHARSFKWKEVEYGRCSGKFRFPLADGFLTQAMPALCNQPLHRNHQAESIDWKNSGRVSFRNLDFGIQAALALRF